MKNEYIPSPTQSIWLLFDLSNGHAPTKRYAWWFNSKKEAIEHRKWQLKRKYAANLSQPIEYVKK